MTENPAPDGAPAPRRGAETVRYLLLIAALCIISLLMNVFAMRFELALSLIADMFGFMRREWKVSAAFVAVILGTLQLLSYRKRLLRFAVALFHLVALSGFWAFYFIQGRGPLAADIDIAADGLGNLMFLPVETVTFFYREMLGAVAIGLASLLVMDRIGAKMHALRFKAVTPAIALCLYGAGWIFFLLPVNSPYLTQVPVYIRVPLGYASWLTRQEYLYRGLRDKPLPLPLSPAEHPRHLIFIMDESTCGRYLGINGYAGEATTTPFLESVANSYYNYGQACSSTNLSKTSNITFMSGLRFDQIPDDGMLSLRQASIFAYAARAGRESYYLDAQRASRYNYVMPRDHRDFTYLRPPAAQNYYDNDMLAVESLAEILRTAERPTFVFLLKSGSHFNYNNKFPPDFAAEILDNGRVPATYLRALRWNVDEFFKRLQDALDGMDALVVYTSDHGQNFSVSNAGGHAVILGAVPEQANVPLLVWPMSPDADRAFSDCGGYNPAQHDRAWHFQLFPTLMTLMGYEHDAVVERFGPTLFDPPVSDRKFISGYLFNEFGAETTMTIVNQFSLPDEPSNDSAK